MYRVGDFVVYKKDVCKIEDIQKKYGSEYYRMVPIDDVSLVIDVPTDNKLGLIRDVMSKEDALSLIDNVVKIPVIETEEKNMDVLYKELLSDGSYENIIKVIKTVYLRKQEKEEKNKKLSDKEVSCFEKAERRLYNELSVSLGMEYETTKNFVIEKAARKAL